MVTSHGMLDIMGTTCCKGCTISEYYYTYEWTKPGQQPPPKQNQLKPTPASSSVAQKLTQMAQDRRLTQQSQAKGSVLSALQIALPSVVMKRISSTVKPLPHANEEEEVEYIEKKLSASLYKQMSETPSSPRKHSFRRRTSSVNSGIVAVNEMKKGTGLGSHESLDSDVTFDTYSDEMKCSATRITPKPQPIDGVGGGGAKTGTKKKRRRGKRHTTKT